MHLCINILLINQHLAHQPYGFISGKTENPNFPAGWGEITFPQLSYPGLSVRVTVHWPPCVREVRHAQYAPRKSLPGRGWVAHQVGWQGDILRKVGKMGEFQDVDDRMMIVNVDSIFGPNQSRMISHTHTQSWIPQNMLLSPNDKDQV